MARIFIVEDEPGLVFLWRQTVAERAEVIWADNLEDAEDIFNNDQNFDFIVMDCCVPGVVPNSFKFVEKIRKSGYSNPIIAKSGSEAFAQELIKFGASHMAKNCKVHTLMLELLDKITN